MTPAAAGLALWLTGRPTARESAETWARLTGAGPAISSLTGLTGEAGRRFEAANRTLVTSRMKRSGQRWSRHGGQGVLTFRSLAKSGRFDRAWAKLARSWQPWRPPARCEAANDNRALALAA